MYCDMGKHPGPSRDHAYCIASFARAGCLRSESHDHWTNVFGGGT